MQRRLISPMTNIPKCTGLSIHRATIKFELAGARNLDVNHTFGRIFRIKGRLDGTIMDVRYPPREKEAEGVEEKALRSYVNFVVHVHAWATGLHSHQHECE